MSGVPSVQTLHCSCYDKSVGAKKQYGFISSTNITVSSLRWECNLKPRGYIRDQGFIMSKAVYGRGSVFVRGHYSR